MGKPKFSVLKLKSGGLDELWEFTAGTITCPKCGCPQISFLIPKSLGSCVVDCRCDACGHAWSVRVVLPLNLFGKKK